MIYDLIVNMTQFKEGDDFPEFSLKNQKDEKISKSDLDGQKFILFSYPRALTPGCTKEVCSIRDNFTLLENKGFKIFGISNDPHDKNKKFADKYELQYDLLSDVKAELLEKIGAYGEKQMYGNTYMGTIRKSYIVDEKHKVRKIFNKVKTATHGDELLNEIDQLDL